MINKCISFKNHKKSLIVLESNIFQIYPSLSDDNVSHIILKNGHYFRAETIQEVFIDLNGLYTEAVTMVSSEDHVR
jgi:hypothetical protein